MNLKTVSTALALLISSNALALPSMQSAFVAKYPATANSALNACSTCHMPIKEGFVNSYGLALKNASMNFAAIEALPAAVPGKTNLDQITAFMNPGSQAVDPEKFEMINEQGLVQFNHGAHIMDAKYQINGKCETCHAPDKFAKVYDPAIVTQDVAHDTCKNCHKTSGSPNAPKKCAQCHTE